MLRVTEIRLPLDHAPDALREVVMQRLQIPATAIIHYTVARRGYDARKRGAITFIYTLDVEVEGEAALLARFKGDPHITLAPDSTYQFVTHAPAGLNTRPVVIGTGPCGFMAALLLAQMGFRPIILERGKAVRERTKDTWALWR